jgi:hypothetical protein
MKKNKNRIKIFIAGALFCVCVFFSVYIANAETPSIEARRQGDNSDYAVPPEDSDYAVPPMFDSSADYVPPPASNYGNSSSGISAPTQSGSGLSLPTGFGLPDPTDGIKGILVKIVNWLLAIVGLVALIAFIVSGLQYFFAAGDERSMETAKRNVEYSILGIIVALSGFVIVQAIDAILKATTNIF